MPPLSAAEAGARRAKRKAKYSVELLRCLANFKNIIVVNVDNVGSSQMQKVRLALRGSAVLLMGKNTVMRKIIRQEGEKKC